MSGNNMGNNINRLSASRLKGEVHYNAGHWHEKVSEDTPDTVGYDKGPHRNGQTPRENPNESDEPAGSRQIYCDKAEKPETKSTNRLLSRTPLGIAVHRKKAEKLETETTTRRFWLTLLVTFSILDSVLFILLIKVSVDLSGRGGQAEEAGDGRTSGVRGELLEDSPFCLPCSEVYLTELEVHQNRFNVRQRMDEGNKTLLCCAESHDDLNTLIGTMYIRVHYTRDRANGLVSVANGTTADSDDQALGIIPHLMLYRDTGSPHTAVNGTHKVPLKVKPGEPTSEYNSTSLIFHNGSVKVARPGHFYIYSHVPFKSSSPPSTHTQYVYRVRNGGDQLLLQNSVYPCVASSQSCQHSFVAGIFLLEKGDEISLTVSNYTSIEREKELRFGIQRL